MPTKTIRSPDGTLETDITDEDVVRVADTPVVENTGNIGYSKAVMKLFRRAKKAGKKVDAASRISVAEMQAKRDAKVAHVAKVETPVTKPSAQRTFADFIG